MTETCSKTTAAPNQGEVAFGYWETLQLALSKSGLATPPLGNDENAITVEQYLSAFEEGIKHDESFGLLVGESVSLKTFPILGMTLLSCSTLHQALSQILRYESLNHDLGRSDLLISDQCSRFRWTANPIYLPAPDSQISFQLALSVFSGIKTFAPLLLQQALPIKQINFEARKPKASSNIAHFFECPIQYGSDENSIEVAPDVLDLNLTFGDPSTFSALTAHADSLLVESSHKRDFVKRVQALLPSALRKQAFRVEDIALELQLSSRSVQRKLKEQGYSFQSLLDETRLTLAQRYLKENKLSMSEIAFLIGYQEQSSFNHAFKNWTGQSPRDFCRHNLLNNESIAKS